jgi:PqqA peptide cyclase
MTDLASINETAQTSDVHTPRPFGLLCEMTYRCPLHCPYCSNPTHYPATTQELTADEWERVLHEASDLGVLHVLFSGGEPLLRPDLARLVAAARSAGLYTNLITSAIGLTRARAAELKSAGLDSVQISFQADQAPLADTIAGTRAHAHKLEAARIVRELELPLTVNTVLHRSNIERLPNLIALAEQVGAERLELANTQFYGWAFRNKTLLLPTREQLRTAAQIAAAAKARLRGKMELLYILPDYYGERPKPCMNGWGQRYLTVNPVGDVLPCPTAGDIPDLCFDNIRHRSLDWIWRESSAFNRFRGTDWMRDPCRSCSLRDIDYGGCRCQAALLTQDAANTDPACALSPHRETLLDILQQVPATMETGGDLATVGAWSGIEFRANPTANAIETQV